MKLIVGLGNPGKEYENTRHNCGFKMIDYYTKENNLSYKTKYKAEYAETTINNEKVIFIKPQTFMNLSGNAVIEFVNFYHIEPQDILIIYDDINFEVGTYKIRRKGSCGGHNGIRSIINCLHTEEIPRLKIGISANKGDLVDYVLKDFSKKDKELLEGIMPTVSKIIEDFTVLTIDKLMEKYNGINNEG